MELDGPSTSSGSKKRKLHEVDAIDISSSKEPGRPNDDSIWTSLPEEILLQIFSNLLSNGDVCNARLTCKSWYSILEVPEQWRRRKFSLVMTNNDSEAIINPKAALFMANFGKHLRSLEVEMTSGLEGIFALGLQENFNFTDYIKFLFKTLKEFFAALPPGDNLKEFSFFGFSHFSQEFLELTLGYPGVSSLIRRKSGEIMTVLCSVIQRQYGLERIFLTGCGLKMKPALKLLNALTPTTTSGNHHGPNLSTLVIDDFFDELNRLSDSQQFNNFLSKMQFLKKLVVNFEYLSDASLQVFADNLKELVQLNLACYDIMPFACLTRLGWNTLTSNGWTYLADHLPDLQTTVQLREVVSKPSLDVILIPEMPLTHIKLYYAAEIYNVETDGPLEVMRILSGSGWFENTLRSFHMQLEQTRVEHFTEVEEEELLRMSRAIKLEKISVPVNLSENFLQNIKEIRPDIELLYTGHGYQPMSCW